MERRTKKSRNTPKQGKFARLRKLLKGKEKGAKLQDPKGGAGWKVLHALVGIPSSFEAAFQRGGVHESLNAMSKQLDIAEGWLKENRIHDAEKLYKKVFPEKMPRKKRQKLWSVLLSPILAARLANIQARGKQLKKRIEKRKERLGMDALPQHAPKIKNSPNLVVEERESGEVEGSE